MIDVIHVHFQYVANVYLLFVSVVFLHLYDIQSNNEYYPYHSFFNEEKIMVFEITFI